MNACSVVKTTMLFPTVIFVTMGIIGCASPKATNNREAMPLTVAKAVPVPAVEKKRDIRAENIQRLLSAAEDALVAKRFTTPVQDNAYDRYQAVLMMDAGNQRALAGIQAIFSKYASMTRSAIRQGDFTKARSKLEKARFVDSHNADLSQLTNELVIAQRQHVPRPQTAVAAVTKNKNEVILNVASLSQRDDALVEQLQSLAVNVKEKDESVLIYARNDAEGRWIYKKMAEAVIGYRLRGDMRIGKKPKIQILPPID